MENQNLHAKTAPVATDSSFQGELLPQNGITFYDIDIMAP